MAVRTGIRVRSHLLSAVRALSRQRATGNERTVCEHAEASDTSRDYEETNPNPDARWNEKRKSGNQSDEYDGASRPVPLPQPDGSTDDENRHAEEHTEDEEDPEDVEGQVVRRHG